MTIPVSLNPSITYITAGAAGMYCGSCMHDNTLARALSAEGYDTQLVPTYTPIRLDEKDITIDQLFFGGINVFLQQKVPLFRHIPMFMDRILDNPRLIRRVTSRAIETDGKLLGSLLISMLKGKSGNQKKEVKRLVKWLSQEARPDVIILSNILIGGFIPELKKSLDAPVIVTLQGDDVFLESLTENYRKQALKLISGLDQHIDGYVVHSKFYADFMSTYCGLERDKMYVTPLGIDTADYLGILRDRQLSADVNIGFLARISAEKGFHHLVTAFIELKKLDQMQCAKLQIAGWLGKDQESFANQQFKRLDDAGLSGDYQYHGSVDRVGKLRMLSDVDILCVPTELKEPKGLYVLEAMACGIPVVQPNHGVFPELIEDLGGGVLFEPGNIRDLVEHLSELVASPQRRLELGNTGRESVLQRRDGKAMAEATISVIKQVLSDYHD